MLENYYSTKESNFFESFGSGNLRTYRWFTPACTEIYLIDLEEYENFIISREGEHILLSYEK